MDQRHAYDVEQQVIRHLHQIANRHNAVIIFPHSGEAKNGLTAESHHRGVKQEEDDRGQQISRQTPRPVPRIDPKLPAEFEADQKRRPPSVPAGKFFDQTGGKRARMPSGQVAQIPIGEDQQKNEGESSEPDRKFCDTATKPSHFIDSFSSSSKSNYRGLSQEIRSEEESSK